MSVTMGVNKSPYAGKSGKQLTSRQIRERLDKELETNVALQVKDTPDADKFEVYGRGLLHLTVLMETMRREGFELMVGPPKAAADRVTPRTAAGVTWRAWCGGRGVEGAAEPSNKLCPCRRAPRPAAPRAAAGPREDDRRQADGAV